MLMILYSLFITNIYKLLYLLSLYLLKEKIISYLIEKKIIKIHDFISMRFNFILFLYFFIKVLF